MHLWPLFCCNIHVAAGTSNHSGHCQSLEVWKACFHSVSRKRRVRPFVIGVGGVHCTLPVQCVLSVLHLFQRLLSPLVIWRASLSGTPFRQNKKKEIHNHSSAAQRLDRDSDVWQQLFLLSSFFLKLATPAVKCDSMTTMTRGRTQNHNTRMRRGGTREQDRLVHAERMREAKRVSNVYGVPAHIFRVHERPSDRLATPTDYMTL